MRNHTPDSASVRKYQRLNELRLAMLDRTERDYRLLDADDNDFHEPFMIDDRFNKLYEASNV